MAGAIVEEAVKELQSRVDAIEVESKSIDRKLDAIIIQIDSIVGVLQTVAKVFSS